MHSFVGKQPCFRWQKDGTCHFGDKCRFDHDIGGKQAGGGAKADRDRTSSLGSDFHSNWTKECRKLNLDAQCVRKAMGDCEPSGSECKQCKKSAPRHWMRSADIDRFIKDSEIGFWDSAAGKKIYKNMRRDFQREVDKK